MIENVWSELIPELATRGDALLRERSPMYWPEKIDTPTLLMHGGADWRASPVQTLLFAQKLEQATHKTVRQKVKLKSGIDKDTAKTIQKAIKELKLKVNASIQGDALRVSGAKRDDLQAVIAHLKANPPGIPLQFTNYR